MYTIEFSKNAEKQLYSLENNVQERIISALERIRIRPEAYVKRLVGDSGYSFRVGDYRLIMDIETGRLLIFVIKICHRKNVYKS